MAWSPPRCRFAPSCSQYTLEAVVAHGRGPRLVAGDPPARSLSPVEPGWLRPGPPKRTYVRMIREAGSRGASHLGRHQGGDGLDPQLLLRHRPECRIRDHHAHHRGAADPLPAHRQAGEVDDRHAAGAARDEEAAGEVQERQAEAQRRADEVLQGEPDQPARGLPAAPGADADLHRALPDAARDPALHPARTRRCTTTSARPTRPARW